MAAQNSRQSPVMSLETGLSPHEWLYTKALCGTQGFRQECLRGGGTKGVGGLGVLPRRKKIKFLNFGA